MSSGSAESRSQWLEGTLEAAAPGAARSSESMSGRSTLEQLVAATAEQNVEQRRFLDTFLAESDVGAAIRMWLGRDLPANPGEIARRLNRDVAALDAIINSQINAI